MAEQFLTLMGDLDEEAQARMAEWYDQLHQAGFVGTQTPGLPYHISLSTFPLEQEREAVELTRTVADTFGPVPVHVSHIGLFAPGRVLFGAPERNPSLDALHDACRDANSPWTAPCHAAHRRAGNSLRGGANPAQILSALCLHGQQAAPVRLLAQAGDPVRGAKGIRADAGICGENV